MHEQACIFNIQKFSIHDGPGIRTVIFFKGCPLRCYWCSNPESQSGKPEKMWHSQKNQETIVGNYKTIDEIVNEVMQDEPFYLESDGGVTFSGGEVLFQVDFATKLAKVLHHKGIHITCETTGFAEHAAFEEFISNIDLLYFDVKHYNPDKHKKGIGVDNKQILANLQYALAHHHNLIVRVPVIPDFNDSLKDASYFAELFLQLGIDKIELLPFHQFGEKKYQSLKRNYQMANVPQLHSEDLLEHQAIFKQAGINCLIR
ncbi:MULTISPECIES: glycyl-radical enzyme activating protein [unclassified Enterococcus]|uniref:glycyl-radical enzyme activating protein n=1 Tax=unclassified Enterococcus TaxID=2608891 RepID=UPI001553A4EC|nr:MULTISPECIES: glycyl-radical enzyme activating protein [unclassified Enterococcus]MBS7577814.1 glycyl-radical enzyme activating protein [Enterococcus sp. MMGLQ5-2]MBS7585074.1 glycyl-radical enzyme activating protein [Enterococcus sp. MMGLQ5-1]NPD12930.1 glycyl-radical enzyme activating protein [Enterococcus sp. MMGLQ5-1]NPD37644.1 glycyl-radical enzyme activating protein [Enterococcus sp. MMGLQ5-2]